MRTLAKNKQHMYYSNQSARVPKYEYDSQGFIKYIIVDGQKVAVTTGDYEDGYSLPIEFDASIRISGGEVQAVEFGIDVGNYDATLIVDKNSLDISETSIIWYTSEVKYKDLAKTIVDPDSADYRVKRIVPSLNEHRYLLERIVK